MRLGTARWKEGRHWRETLVAPLTSDPTRVVDQNRLEQARQQRLGEGHPQRLADALVPGDIQKVLEGGRRAVQRVRQALAYAEKWHRRGDLPMLLAPSLEALELRPCVPYPTALHRWDGVALDVVSLRGPGAVLEGHPHPTLAAVGIRDGGIAGHCLAVQEGDGTLLGAWLDLDPLSSGHLEFRVAGHVRTAPLDAWMGLELRPLEAAEVVLLPPPRFRKLPFWPEGTQADLLWPAERLTLLLGSGLPHPTMQ